MMASMIAAKGYTAATACDGEDALEKIGQEDHFNAIVTDLVMPRLDGFRLLATLLERGETTPAIVLTGLADIGHAVSVVRDLRAFWYLQKPVDPGILGILLERAVNYDKLMSEAALLRRQVGYTGSLDQFVGRSTAMQQVFSLIQQVAPTSAQVLITGESGTGKELTARAIHRMSPRAENPFVVINCAALPETLIEKRNVRTRTRSFYLARWCAARDASSRRTAELCSWTRSRRDALGRTEAKTSPCAAGQQGTATGWKRRNSGRRPPDRRDKSRARGCGERQAAQGRCLLPLKRVRDRVAGTSSAQGRYSRAFRGSTHTRFQ